MVFRHVVTILEENYADDLLHSFYKAIEAFVYEKSQLLSMNSIL